MCPCSEGNGGWSRQRSRTLIDKNRASASGPLVNPLDRPGAHPYRTSYLCPRRALRRKLAYSRNVHDRAWSPDVPALRASVAQSSLDALSDAVALKFCERSTLLVAEFSHRRLELRRNRHRKLREFTNVPRRDTLLAGGRGLKDEKTKRAMSHAHQGHAVRASLNLLRFERGID